MKLVPLLVSVIFAFTATLALADDFDDLFPEVELDANNDQPLESESLILQIKHQTGSNFVGELSQSSVLSASWQNRVGLRSRAQADVRLSLDWPTESNHAQNATLIFGDAYLQTTRGNWSTKVGRQTVSWGESDTAIVADVISPRDYSHGMYQDAEYSKLSQWLLDVTHFGNNEQMTMVFIPSARTDRLEIGSQERLVWEPEFAVQVKKTIGKSDWSWILADLKDNQLVNGDLTRYQMAATTVNWAKGNGNLQLEAAYNLNREFVFGSSDQFQGAATYSFLQSGYRTWTAGIAYDRKFALNSPDEQTEIWDTTLSISEHYFNEVLTVGSSSQFQWPTQTMVFQLVVDWDVTDAFRVSIESSYLDDLDDAEFESVEGFLVRVRYVFGS